MYNKICKQCSTPFTTKYNKTTLCSPECVSKSIKEGKKSYTPEQAQEIIQLRKANTPINDMCVKFGLSKSSIKRLLAENNVTIDKDIGQQNAFKAKLAKNPNALEDMRAAKTAESYKQQSETLKQTFSDPKYRKILSDRSYNTWANIDTESPEFKQMKLEASKKQVATKLGMSLEEYESKVAYIKTQVENKAGTVTGLARSMGLDSSTVIRRFHKNGWQDLLFQKFSQGQAEIFAYVQELVGDQAVMNNRSALDGLELDIYVPSLKVGIEYNGLYWHSEASESFKPGAHKNKAQKCMSKGIKLFAIFEDEWKDPVKKELIKHMIAHYLGKSNAVKLDARKLTKVQLSNPADFQPFFAKFHIDGPAINSNAALGLKDPDGNLVMCVSFRKNFNGEFELARMATDYNYIVRGGAGKLLSQLQDIVSYSNNRLSDGDVYRKLGFTEITQTEAPSYWYTDFETRVWRFKCKKQNDPEIVANYPTEKLQAEAGVFSKAIFGDERSLYKIEDYGHKKWIKIN